MSSKASLLRERLRPKRSRLSFVVTGLSSRIGARTLLMDRPRGVGGGAKLMSAPRAEDPERERSASMPESPIGTGARDGLAGVGMALAMMAARVMALLALVMVSLAPALLVLALLALLALLLPLALPPPALPALVLVGTRARRLEQKRREPREASGPVREWRRRQQPPLLQGAVAAVEA